MEELLPTSEECLHLEQEIDWTTLPGSSPITFLLLECVQECYHGNRQLALQRCEELLDVTWEHLNTGHWKDVKVAWRHIFSWASLLKVVCLYNMQNYKDALEACDRGLLMGAPIRNGILTQLASCLHSRAESSKPESPRSSGPDHPAAKRMKMAHPKNIAINKEREIARVEAPSLESFLVDHMEKNVPVIIEGAMGHWPARSTRPWSLAYIRKVAGQRTVPVEIGAKYTDDSWSQSLMTINEFIDHHIDIQQNSSEHSKVGYLAQHQLFDQIPELKNDICIPDYCCLHSTTSQECTGTNSNVTTSRGGNCITDSADDVCDSKEKNRDGVDIGGQSEQKDERGMEDGAKGYKIIEGRVGKGEEYERVDSQKVIVQGQELDGETIRTTGGIEGQSEGQQEDGEIERKEGSDRPDDGGNEGEDEAEEEDIDINAWFGPQGTVSPLHFDPKHNLLCQVIGQKYIRLYGEECTPLLYKREGLLSNTSQVDVEDVDENQFPLFHQAPYQEAVLSEGEMLYIPPRCWHYIRSLSVSFSVSFWWT